MSDTVCLCMIVRDEQDVLARAIQSALPHIHRIAILDTGSTDGTIAIARRYLDTVPGAVAVAPWEGFSASRNRAIDLARQQGCDAILLLDADEQLVAPRGIRPLGEHDCVEMRREHAGGDIEFSRPALVRSSSPSFPAYFAGDVHEALILPPEATSVVDCRHDTYISYDGKSARGTEDPGTKYRRDADILRRQLQQDPTDPRATFYLAQSLRDCGQLREAIDAYRARIALGGWEEEVWYSRYQIALLQELLGYPAPAVIWTYLTAIDVSRRREPVVHLARYYRLRGLHVQALGVLLAARRLGGELHPGRELHDVRKARRLFVEPSAYGWRFDDELSLAYYHVDLRRDAAACATSLLGASKMGQNGYRVPHEDVQRITANLEWFSGGRDGV